MEDEVRALTVLAPEPVGSGCGIWRCLVSVGYWWYSQSVSRPGQSASQHAPVEDELVHAVEVRLGVVAGAAVADLHVGEAGW